MWHSNPYRRIRECARGCSIRAAAALLIGTILIAAGMMLGLRNSRVTKGESPILPATPAPSSTPAASIPAGPSDAGKSPTPGPPVAADREELGQTLEQFQAEYESLSAKAGGQEAFFKDLVGKKVVWTVRVDQVFRTEAGMIVIFSSTERPDWAAFPISDARFPLQLEKQLMTLSRGDVIKMEGKIVYRGIKTLECSNFELIRNETPSG